MPVPRNSTLEVVFHVAAYGMAAFGLIAWLFPRFNGLLFTVSDTDASGRTIALVLFVLAAIFWVASALLRKS